MAHIKGTTEREKEAGSEMKNPFKVRAFDLAMHALESCLIVSAGRGHAGRRSLRHLVRLYDIGAHLILSSDKGCRTGIKRRVDEFLSRAQPLNVVLYHYFPRVVPTVLQASLDGESAEKRAILDAVRLFQTVSGIGCVHVNVHLYGVTNVHLLHLLGLPVPIGWRKRVHGLSPILRIGPNSSIHCQQVYNGSQVPDAVKLKPIPRASIEKIEALAHPLLTIKGFEVHFTGS